MKVLEAALVAATTATVGFAMIYFLNDCRPLGQDPTRSPIQVQPCDSKLLTSGFPSANLITNPLGLLWGW